MVNKVVNNVCCNFCNRSQLNCNIVYRQGTQMGNQQPKKVGRASKTQIDVAALKARIHLQLMRDRKNAEVIKGDKQLVAKIKNSSRNKTEQILIAERVVNGLKYAGACNMLMAHANSIKSQSSYLADNIGNPQKMQPWLPMIYSLLYAADRLGLSSLNEFKSAMRALNDPAALDIYVYPDIRQLLSATPTAEELNIYMVEMSERNGIPIEEINMVGHRFTKDFKGGNDLDNDFSAMEKKLAEQLGQGFNNQGGNNQGGNNQGGNQGFQGGSGGGQLYQPPAFQQQQHQKHQNQNNGYFNQNQQMSQGYNQQGFNQYNQQGFNSMQQQQTPLIPPPMINPNQQQNLNPYKGLSNIQSGPTFYQPSNVNPRQTKKQEPRQFPDFNDIIDSKKGKEEVEPVYPSVNFDQLGKMPSYKPSNPYQNNEQPHQKPQQQVSPTISQILRDFDTK